VEHRERDGVARPGQHDDEIDNPLERLELLVGDDEAVASYLDELEVHSPREREMLTELARPTTIARPDAFDAAHRRAVSALETLARHGYAGSRAGSRLGPLRLVIRFLVELVARYIVVSYLRSVATSMRNLYWLREIESRRASREFKLLRPARMDAEALEIIFKRREIGLPTFVIGGVLVPVLISIANLTSGAVQSGWWRAVIAGLVGALVVVAISWVLLRGAAMAGRRTRLTAQQPLETLWSVLGASGRAPRNQSRKIALVGIVLSVAAWILVPLAVAIALAR
jgi:hypothetical protein